MIIQEIHIDNFGIFNHFTLANLQPGLNIIEGSNEAGKTTLFSFIKYTLFGYPDLRSSVNTYLFQKTGKRQGRIIARLSSGEKVIFERTEGSKGGHITLSSNNQTSHDPDRWFDLLGNATADLFYNIYAISLDELNSIASLSSSGVEEKIFSIGIGMSNVSIGEIETDLSNRINRIYKPRNNKTELVQIVGQINELHTRISETGSMLPSFERLTGEASRIEKEIANLHQESVSLRSELITFKNYLTCYEHYLIYTNTCDALNELPEVSEYPDDGIHQLEQLIEKKNNLHQKIGELESGTAEEAGIRELTEQAETIELNEDLAAYSDMIEYLRKNFEKYKQTLHDFENDENNLRRINQEISYTINRISNKWQERNIVDFSNLIIHQNRITNFLDRFNNLEEKKRERELRARLSSDKAYILNIRFVIITLVLICIILAVPAFLSANYSWGIAFLLIAILLFSGRRYILSKQVSGSDGFQEKAVTSEEEKLKEEYRAYLNTQLQLTESLSPVAVLEILKEAERLKKEIVNRDEIREEQNKQRKPFIERFEQSVKELKSIAGSVNSADSMEITVDRIIAVYDQTIRNTREKEKLDSVLNRKRRELEISITAFKEIETAVSDLLKTVKATDITDFKLKYQLNAKIKALQQTKQNALQTIQTIIGMKNIDRLLEYFSHSTKEEIENRISSLEDNLNKKETEIREHTIKMGAINNELKRMEGTADLSRTLTELETQKLKLRGIYKEWISGKLALKILAEVKAGYEKKQQPIVIKNSSTYFSAITGQRYSRIHVSLDRKEVKVFDKREQIKTIDQLSRGTREQLLLSLRLGFIKAYEEYAAPLPVILDEVLVNFDQQRAKKTAEILHEFGNGRQILFITCHPETKKYFSPSAINLIHI